MAKILAQVDRKPEIRVSGDFPLRNDCPPLRLDAMFVGYYFEMEHGQQFAVVYELRIEQNLVLDGTLEEMAARWH